VFQEGDIPVTVGLIVGHNSRRMGPKLPHVAAAVSAFAPQKAKALIARTAFYIFVAVSVFALSYASYVITDAYTYQATEQSKFESVSPSEERHPAIVGGVIGEMEVPRLGLKAIFVQGDSPRILRRAVGHIPETALPGELGNIVLTGHRDTFFRPLRNIQLGDGIKIKTLDGEFEYRVESTEVVSPSDLQVLQPSSGNTLTLVTCFPFYYVGAAPKRFIVRAHQIGRLPTDSSIP
jgi:sortase A